MEEKHTVAALQSLGFTEYEARAYATLVREGELNGYELAKKTGIPRANVYAVVQKLVTRGALLRTEHGRSHRFTPVPPSQLLQSLESQHKRALATAEEALARHTPAPASTAVFNLRGHELLTRAHQLIDSCQSRLLIALQPSEATALAGALKAADARGVHITTLCLQACEYECGGCQGAVYRHLIAPHEASHWLVMVTDDDCALVGQAFTENAEGLTTHQPLMVKLATAFIRQSLVLATMASQLDQHLPELLSPATLARLNDLYPDGGLPAYLRTLGGCTA